MTPLRIFIGYEPRQPIAFHVLSHSIMKRATKPVSITPLVLPQLPISRRGLTDFTYSRFLVPWLCDYKGWAIFIDSDFLCLGDICAMDKIEMDASVYVVKGQHRYEWSSMMVFDNARCHVLTPEYVQTSPNPLMFQWADEIGEVHKDWNHLVGYDEPNPKAKLIHFTQGIPIWPETHGCEYSDEWNREALISQSTVSFETLMGNSVHAPHVYARLQRESPHV